MQNELYVNQYRNIWNYLLKNKDIQKNYLKSWKMHYNNNEIIYI